MPSAFPSSGRLIRQATVWRFERAALLSMTEMLNLGCLVNPANSHGQFAQRHQTGR
jgi:hypothetical protein